MIITMTRNQWAAANPHLNPDNMTAFGVRWTLAERQVEELQRRDDEDVHRDERFFESYAP